jgi:hypothetical protein
MRAKFDIGESNTAQLQSWGISIIANEPDVSLFFEGQSLSNTTHFESGLKCSIPVSFWVV